MLQIFYRNNINVPFPNVTFSALDMVARRDILDYIISFKQAGGIVIIASHEESVFKVCDKVYLIENGNVSQIPGGPDEDYVNILRKSIVK